MSIDCDMCELNFSLSEFEFNASPVLLNDCTF